MWIQPEVMGKIQEENTCPMKPQPSLRLGKLRTDPNLLPVRGKGSLILFSNSVLETPPFSVVYFILPFQTGFLHCASSTQTKLSRHWLQSQLKSIEAPNTHFHVFGFNTQRDPWFIFPETKEKAPLDLTHMMKRNNSHEHPVMGIPWGKCQQLLPILTGTKEPLAFVWNTRPHRLTLDPLCMTPPRSSYIFLTALPASTCQSPESRQFGGHSHYKSNTRTRTCGLVSSYPLMSLREPHTFICRTITLGIFFQLSIETSSLCQ